MEPREGWNKPLPEQMARPTYWPAVLAASAVIALLGPVTNMAVTGVGLVLGGAALIGWIGEMLSD